MATYHLRVKNDTQPSEKKVSAKRHADYILREDGKSHADYINREGAQGEKTDCVFKSSLLSKWAKGSPQKFFSVAIHYERKGNRRYKGIELSLPHELTLEQNREIVDKFIRRAFVESLLCLCDPREKRRVVGRKAYPRSYNVFRATD